MKLYCKFQKNLFKYFTRQLFPWPCPPLWLLQGRRLACWKKIGELKGSKGNPKKDEQKSLETGDKARRESNGGRQQEKMRIQK
jgi:hypothetical protein